MQNRKERKEVQTVCVQFRLQGVGEILPSQELIDETDQKEMREQAPQLPGGRVPDRAANTQTLC